MKKNKLINFLNARAFVFILIIGLIFRLLFFITLQPWEDSVVENTILIQDARGYNDLAIQILTNKSFEDFAYARTPVYPLFIVMCHLISGKSVMFVIIVQILLSLSIMIMAFKIVQLFLDKRTALFTMFLLAIDFHQAQMAIELYTETLFTLIFIISIYYLCLAFKKKNQLKYFIISGFFIGLATLTRPISFLYPVVVVFFIFIYNILWNNGSNKIIRPLWSSLIFLVVFIIVVSPWLLRNYKLYGEAKLTSLSGYNLLFYNVAVTEAEKNDITWEETYQMYKVEALESGCDTANMYSFENSRIYSQIATEYIKNNFILYCKSHFKGMVDMFYEFEKIEILKSKSGIEKYRMLGFLIYFGIIYLFSILGLILSVKRKYIFALLFVLTILYFNVITGVVGDSRFRVPIMPYVYIFCSIGLIYCTEKLLPKKLSLK